MQFDIYVPVTEQPKALQFLADFNQNIARSEIKETLKVPDIITIDRESKLFILTGSAVFRDSQDAQRTFTDLLAKVTIDRTSIEYGELIITENTHHWPNPLPDNVLNSDTKGVITNLDKYDFTVS